MMEEPTNLDALLYKLFLNPDGQSAVFRSNSSQQQNRRLCHSEPEKSEEHLMKVEKERWKSIAHILRKTSEQLLQQLMDLMLLIEMLPKIFEFLPFLNQHLSS
jgi:hypothetical protein